MATKVQKVLKLNPSQFIRYQLIQIAFIKDVRFSDTEINCLTLLGELGEIRLSDFSDQAVSRGILGSSAAVNNCLSKIEKSGFFIKKGAGKKKVYLNPELGIMSGSDVLLVYNVIQYDPKVPKVSLPENSKKAELA